MENKSISIEYKEYNSIDELPAAEKELLQSAIDATKGAYAPYSKFRVGAAVSYRGQSGKCGISVRLMRREDSNVLRPHPTSGGKNGGYSPHSGRPFGQYAPYHHIPLRSMQTGYG